MEFFHTFSLVFTIILFNAPIYHAEYGGNDIFTSLEAMRRLWLEERIFVAKIEQVIKSVETILPIMQR